MLYLSLILSIFILFFVIRLMFFQRRFDLLNGIIITGALIVVLLDIDTIVTDRKYTVTGIISLGIIILWLINMGRKPKDHEEKPD